ncbi:MAG: helix-turn-helix transcriptional regulator, partial [Clostridia bacterium]|nr:helix-turn-helix transcriptional regulator [Clostridia bacterium]
KEGWSHSGRYMKVNLLAVIRKGECTFRINETEYTLAAGDVVLVPKNTYYKPHTDSSCEYTFFHFDGELFKPDEDSPSKQRKDEGTDTSSLYGYIEELPSDLILDYKTSTREKQKDVELILTKCISIRSEHQTSRQILLSLHFSELLCILSDILTENLQSYKSYPQSLSKLIYYINQNYTKNLQLEDIAAHTSFSKQYCMRLFKKHMGRTINDYILELRMKHASYLLRETYMNVNEASDYLGFSSVSYFSRVFKKYYGVSPSEYSE